MIHPSGPSGSWEFGIVTLRVPRQHWCGVFIHLHALSPRFKPDCRCFSFSGGLAMPLDWIVLGLWLLRKPRPDGTMAGELRFLVLTVAHVSFAAGCVKQVLRGVSHFSQQTWKPGSLQMKTRTMHWKGNGVLSTPEERFARCFLPGYTWQMIFTWLMYSQGYVYDLNKPSSKIVRGS